MLDCRQVDCRCTDGNRCRFHQGYAEGSSYDGYVVTDSIRFGEFYHEGHDSFTYAFGCVKKETHYFYSQEADGILGLSAIDQGRKNANLFEPIYDTMFNAQLIKERSFSLCLGKNGGYL